MLHRTAFVQWPSRHWPGRAFVWLIASAYAALAAAAASELTFFESKVRPLLSEHCFSCHSETAEKLKGGLRLDSLEGLLTGGDSGPAIVPGDPERSLVIQAVRYLNPDLQMPPKGQRLSRRQIADLTQWIKTGATWPLSEKTSVPRGPKSPQEITDKDRNWWAFQPIVRPALPDMSHRERVWSGHPIDAFIDRELSAQRLRGNPAATRRELVRRAYFDLIGLPPTPEEVLRFETDRSSQAWPRLIDYLLSLPQYGERWGRHWLDVARYAQSNGYERDGEKPESWRYRDYVVKAFNEDKPYDRFVKEQIAGDELDHVTLDSIVATGFQRLGVWDDEPDDKRMAEFDELDDVVSTTGSAFLGLTVGCARCHEHKFDPIPQADYYQLLSFFRNIRLNEAARYSLDSPNYVPLAEPERLEAWQRGQKSRLTPMESKLAALTNAADRKVLSKQIDELKAEKPPFEWALAVRERGSNPPPTHILIRGNAGNPGVEVKPAFLSVLGGGQAIVPPGKSTSLGRRRALAEWIASPNNPLTARVMANRIWQHHFGKGLVKTTSDFGRAGTSPTHPKLLDWLAAEFIENGWSMKKLHKTIMLSEAYQRSSRAENDRAIRVDPGNELLWRQEMRRLEAETLRDTILAISGNLNPKMGGRGFFPHLSGEVLAGQSRPGLDWEISSSEELSRRSLYAFVRRTMSIPMLEAFDYSNTSSPLSERPVTTVAPQALLLLNDEFMQQQAAGLADRIAREAGPTLDKRIARGFEIAISRGPTKGELRQARDFVTRQESEFNKLATRMTFRVDVPTSLSVSYMNILKPQQFFNGPASGWSYHRGKWSPAYEGIRTVERHRGPFALTTGPAWSNGVVAASVLLHTACESSSILLRASAKSDELRGYEVAFEPREQRLVVRRHADDMTVLAQAKTDIPSASSLRVKIQLVGGEIRVWLGDREQPVLACADATPVSGTGNFGVKAWGAALSVDNLTMQPERGAPLAIRDERLATSDRRALEALCLLLLNLNEVAYVD